MTPDLDRFTQITRADPKQTFTSLMGLLCRPEGLVDSFGRLALNKAAGVDGMKKADYEVGLEDRLADLSARLRRGGYTPHLPRCFTSAGRLFPTIGYLVVESCKVNECGRWLARSLARFVAPHSATLDGFAPLLEKK
jgi:hypothetical protein